MPGEPGAEIRTDLVASPIVRWAWIGLGLLLVGVGGLGVVLPVLPTTVFFIGAAACFARSSPRLEGWVLGLPGVGPAVRDYRSGLGMPRRAKVVAITMLTIGVAISVWRIDALVVGGLIIVLGLIGVAWILRVPTRA